MRAGSRYRRAAEAGRQGLALHQIWALRGGALVCPPVERREGGDGEEGQSGRSRGLGESQGKTFWDRPLPRPWPLPHLTPAFL